MSVTQSLSNRNIRKEITDVSDGDHVYTLPMFTDDAPFTNSVSYEFYNSGSPVTTGLSGTMTFTATPTENGKFEDIPDGTVDISTDITQLSFSGVVRKLKVSLASISGCDKIVLYIHRAS